ncbi:hypothetical protein TELCIR_09834, partial [Teladorsagia circumcincta]
STMIAAIMEGNRYLSVVNVGDSRAVACDSENRLVALSKDHKPDDFNMSLTYCEGKSDNAISDSREVTLNAVLYLIMISFGDTLLKRLGVITAHPDVLRIDLDSKPLKFLIVGTDGFWDVVSSEEAVNFACDYLRFLKKTEGNLD